MPVALYGIVLLLAAASYTVLANVLVRLHGPDSLVAQAARAGRKEYTSLVCYFVAIALSFVNAWISCALYVAVALLWIVPDRRVESRVRE